MEKEVIVRNYWSTIDKALKDNNITLTILCNELGLKRKTIYSQRARCEMPKIDQQILMAEYLDLQFPGNTLPKVSKNNFSEFIPYLEKADEATLKSVRKLLDMPTEADKENTFRLPSKIMVG